MATTVMVRTFRGAIELRGNTDMSTILGAARRLELPLLMSTDEFDDTTFNQRQAGTISTELGRITQEMEADPEAVAELTHMVEYVLRRAHRYLVFNGD